MHVDVGVVVARDREDAVDLPAWIGIDIGSRADRLGAAPQARDQQLFRTRIVGEPLLRKDTDFDVDPPGIVARKLLDRIEADQLYSGIELDMRAHAHRAVHDAALQRLLRTRIDVLDRESAFRRSGLAHRFGDGTLFGT